MQERRKDIAKGQKIRKMMRDREILSACIIKVLHINNKTKKRKRTTGIIVYNITVFYFLIMVS